MSYVFLDHVIYTNQHLKVMSHSHGLLHTALGLEGLLRDVSCLVFLKWVPQTTNYFMLFVEH